MKLRKIIKLQAFTLLEALIVLVIVSTLLLVGSYKWRNLPAILEEESFIRRFEENYLETQKQAIIYNLNSTIHHLDGEFSFYRADQKFQRYLWLPSGGRVKEAPRSFVFQKESGRTQRMARYTFQLPAKKIEIVYQIQMGSGKYTKNITKIKNA